MTWADIDGLQSLASSRVNENKGLQSPKAENQYELEVRREGLIAKVGMNQKLKLCLSGGRKQEWSRVSSGLEGLWGTGKSSFLCPSV